MTLISDRSQGNRSDFGICFRGQPGTSLESSLIIINTCGFRALDLHRAFGFHRLYKLMTKGIYLVCPLLVRLQFRKADGVRRRFFR